MEQLKMSTLVYEKDQHGHITDKLNVPILLDRWRDKHEGEDAFRWRHLLYGKLIRFLNDSYDAFKEELMKPETFMVSVNVETGEVTMPGECD